MTLAPGTKLGHYEIVGAIGAGGMGDVYRARDTKLNHDVAIKTLPDALVDAPERLARFRREAQVLASLNHPNIGAIYGLEEQDGRPFLVLELVEGEDLAKILKRGPLPVGEALSIARQVTEALEAAHEKGIVHRDLKPANIMVRPDGTVKVLDFGLAKAFALEATGSDLSQSPTVSRQATATGVIMGTASYMSPEQARGPDVDKRTDVWAFACVLFELLTGRKVFEGATVTDVLAAVVHNDPDWLRLPGKVPVHVRKLLSRCLKKPPAERLRDAGDARLLLDDEDESPSARDPGSSLSWAKVAALTLVAAIAGGLTVWSLKRETPKPLTRFATVLPVNEFLAAFRFRVAVSPDGSKIVYRNDFAERAGLFLRSLSDLEPRLIPGSENGDGAFFSPNGEWVAFFNKGRLMKLRAEGGTPLTVAEIGCFGAPSGGSWGEEDSIVVTDGSALLRVHASTGAIEEASTLDSERGEVAHYWPEMLPGGKAVVYNAVIMPLDRRDIVGKFFGSEERRLLIENGVSPRYVRSGHLLFVRENALLAVRFDPARLSVVGEPFPVVEDIAVDVYNNFENAQFDVSESAPSFTSSTTLAPEAGLSFGSIGAGTLHRRLGRSVVIWCLESRRTGGGWRSHVSIQRRVIEIYGFSTWIAAVERGSHLEREFPRIQYGLRTVVVLPSPRTG